MARLGLFERLKWYARGLQQDPESVRLRPFMAAFYLDLGDLATAELLIDQQIDLQKHGQLTTEALQGALLLRQGRYEEALHAAEQNWEGRGAPRWGLLTNLYMRLGDYEQALRLNNQRMELYAHVYGNPETAKICGFTAIYRAAALMGVNEAGRAERLLDNCLEIHGNESGRTGRPYYMYLNIPEVQVHALSGDTDSALSALRAALDSGQRHAWWIDLLHSPLLDSLRDEPEFQAMVEELQEEMAAQLENVREMQRTGDMPPLLSISRNIASARVVLPEPLSPTMPRQCPC